MKCFAPRTMSAASATNFMYDWIYMNVELTKIPKLLAAYSIQMYISPSRAPEGHTETLQLTYIPQLLAEYIHIQYQFIYSTY